MTKVARGKHKKKMNYPVVFKNSKNLARVIYNLIKFEGTFYD